MRNPPQLYDLSEVGLRENDAAILTAGNADRFREKCGDSFIVGKITGGQFFAVYEITTTSAQQRESIEAEAKGSMFAFGSASGEFKKAMKKISSLGKVNIAIHIDGDDGAPIPDNSDEILNYAVEFPKVISEPGKAVTYKTLLLDYQALDLPNDAEPLLKTVAFDNELQFLGQQSDDYAQGISSMRYVMDHEEQFIDVTSEMKDDLSDKIIELRNAQKQVQKYAIVCVKRESECLAEHPGLPSPFIESRLPERVDTAPPLEAEDAIPSFPDVLADSATTREEDIIRAELSSCESTAFDSSGHELLYLNQQGNDLVIVFKAKQDGVTHLHKKVKGIGSWAPLTNTKEIQVKPGSCFVVKDDNVQAGSSYCYVLTGSFLLGPFGTPPPLPIMSSISENVCSEKVISPQN